MKSPFPGMDPYLERHWLDVHTKLVTYAADALNSGLPDDLMARAQERIAVESDLPNPDLFGPDVRVLESVEAFPQRVASSVAGVALAPYRLTTIIDPIVERFIEVREATGERLITVIEFVSPTNKRGKGLKKFANKRDKLVRRKVNFVEIDLVRAGDWRKLLAPWRPPKDVYSVYRATVRVAAEPEGVDFYPVYLRRPLPPVYIPLRTSDHPVKLELQPLIEQAYVNGRYARTLDYTKPPEPPLDPQDAEWADQLLKSAGKR
jgi:hypothetical protein